MPNNRTVKTICKAHENNIIDALNRSHVLAQLESESKKRLESFLFERIFRNLLLREFGKSSVSSGWVFVDGTNQSSATWIKLQNISRSWGDCDENVMQFLTEQTSKVARTFYNPEQREFFAQDFRDKSWSDPIPLHSLLRKFASRSPIGPKNFSESDRNERTPVIDKIDEHYSDSELAELAISRIVSQLLYSTLAWTEYGS